MNLCIFCGRNISTSLSISFIFSFKKLEEPLICDSCLANFNSINSKIACSGCSRTQLDQSFCSDCARWSEKYPELRLNHTALFSYNKMAKEYMKQFKFQGDLILAGLFAKEVAESLKKYQKTHHVVPIPISKESMECRGFNQVGLILEKSGIEYKNWLTHIGVGQRQGSKSRESRLRTNQFLTVNIELNESNKINKPILIVDDVYTTGRTILHAKNVFHTFEEKAERLNKKKEAKKKIKIESFSIFR